MITRVALSDLNDAEKLDGEKLFDLRIGNVMWRSPEAQTGRHVGNFGCVLLWSSCE